MGETKVTVAICTYQRAHLWKTHTLFASLALQDDPEFELLIIDDGSTDNTIEVLRDLLARHKGQFKRGARLFRCLEPKRNPTQSNARPENVLMRHASGDIYLHLDDDGWIDKRTVSCAKRLFREHGQGTYWGRIEFIDPSTRLPYVRPAGVSEDDYDVNLYRDHRALGMQKPVNRMDPAWKMEWGAIWATPLSVLRAMGGHDMETANYRGSDSRLGMRLAMQLPGYYVNQPCFTFHHLGLSWMRERLLARNLDEIVEMQRSAHADNWEPCKVANGGETFWGDGFGVKHEEINL